MFPTRPIGPAHPTFVIAEIGVNHDGSVPRALELVETAKCCGADAVKLQVFRAAQLMNRAARFAEYQKDRVTAADPADMLRQYELPELALREIVAAIKSAGLIPVATPFSLEDVDVIESLDLPAIKIASPDLVNKPLLRRAARSKKPLIVSTGAATLQEVITTTEWLEAWAAPRALLHCVSSYPTPADDLHLAWIAELAQATGCLVGYSDHSTDVLTGALAVAAGARILERHLTYDKRAQGPDHSASSDPAEFAEYVRLTRLAERMLGEFGKRVLPVEEDVRTVSRQSLVTTRALPAGHVLTESDLKPQRPGTGIPAAEIDQTVGRRLARLLPAGELLDRVMLAE
jgi:N,N'-diacetyllegionaminate synthase